MHLILLGGNSSKNKSWVEEIAETLSDLFEDTHIQYYRHWEEGGAMDMGFELRRLVDYASEPEEYAVFAKSAGVMLALRAIQDGDFMPARCVFVGAPLGSSAPEYLSEYAIPTLYIQQTNDPIKPFEKVKNVVENTRSEHQHFLEIPGDNHHYTELGYFIDDVRTFFSSEHASA